MDFYRKTWETPAQDYKENLLVREGYMTTRQGYPNIELGYPMVEHEGLPRYRARDGSYAGPVYFNESAPWNQRLTGARGNGYNNPVRPLSPLDLNKFMESNPSFKNGHYYPYANNFNLTYPNLPQQYPVVTWENPSNFSVKSDELRKWLVGMRK